MSLVRKHPENPCSPSHHPHDLICAEPDCGCDYLTGRPFEVRTCCVCGEDWPCSYRQGTPVP